MAIGFSLQNVVILTIICRISLCEEDLLETVTLKQDNPPELNDFIRSVLRQKDEFRKIRNAAKRFQNLHRPSFQQRGSYQSQDHEAYSSLFNKVPSDLDKSSNHKRSSNNLESYDASSLENNRLSRYVNWPANDVYPYTYHENQQVGLAGYKDSDLTEDFWNDYPSRRFRRGLDLNEYNSEKDFGLDAIRVIPRSRTGVLKVPGNKYERRRGTFTKEETSTKQTQLDGVNSKRDVSVDASQALDISELGTYDYSKTKRSQEHNLKNNEVNLGKINVPTSGHQSGSVVNDFLNKRSGQSNSTIDNDTNQLKRSIKVDKIDEKNVIESIQTDGQSDTILVGTLDPVFLSNMKLSENEENPSNQIVADNKNRGHLEADEDIMVFHNNDDTVAEKKKITLQDVDDPTSAIEQVRLSTRPYNLDGTPQHINAHSLEEDSRMTPETLYSSSTETNQAQFNARESKDMIHGTGNIAYSSEKRHIEKPTQLDQGYLKNTDTDLDYNYSEDYDQIPKLNQIQQRKLLSFKSDYVNEFYKDEESKYGELDYENGRTGGMYNKIRVKRNLPDFLGMSNEEDYKEDLIDDYNTVLKRKRSEGNYDVECEKKEEYKTKKLPESVSKVITNNTEQDNNIIGQTLGAKSSIIINDTATQSPCNNSVHLIENVDGSVINSNRTQTYRCDTCHKDKNNEKCKNCKNGKDTGSVEENKHAKVIQAVITKRNTDVTPAPQIAQIHPTYASTPATFRIIQGITETIISITTRPENYRNKLRYFPHDQNRINQHQVGGTPNFEYRKFKENIPRNRYNFQEVRKNIEEQRLAPDYDNREDGERNQLSIGNRIPEKSVKIEKPAWEVEHSQPKELYNVNSAVHYPKDVCNPNEPDCPYHQPRPQQNYKLTAEGKPNRANSRYETEPGSIVYIAGQPQTVKGPKKKYFHRTNYPTVNRGKWPQAHPQDQNEFREEEVQKKLGDENSDLRTVGTPSAVKLKKLKENLHNKDYPDEQLGNLRSRYAERQPRGNSELYTDEEMPQIVEKSEATNGERVKLSPHMRLFHKKKHKLKHLNSVNKFQDIIESITYQSRITKREANEEEEEEKEKTSAQDFPSKSNLFWKNHPESYQNDKAPYEKRSYESPYGHHKGRWYRADEDFDYSEDQHRGKRYMNERNQDPKVQNSNVQNKPRPKQMKQWVNPRGDKNKEGPLAKEKGLNPSLGIKSLSQKSKCILQQDDMEHGIHEYGQMMEVLNGNLPSLLIDTVFKRVKEQKSLESRFSGSLKKKYEYKNQLKTLESFTSKETKDDIKHTEKLLHQIMDVLNKIVADQVRRRTCKRLSPELHQYLANITRACKEKPDEETQISEEGVPLPLVKGPKAKTRTSDLQQGDFLFTNVENKSELELDEMEIRKKIKMINALLEKYRNMTDRCKIEVGDVEEYLKKHLCMLKDMLRSIKVQQENQRKQGYKSQAPFKLKKADDDLSNQEFETLLQQQLNNVNLNQHPLKPNINIDQIIEENLNKIKLNDLKYSTLTPAKLYKAKGLRNTRNSYSYVEDDEEKDEHKREAETDWDVSEKYRKLVEAARSFRKKRENDERLGELFGQVERRSPRNEGYDTIRSTNKHPEPGYEKPRIFSLD